MTEFLDNATTFNLDVLLSSKDHYAAFIRLMGYQIVPTNRMKNMVLTEPDKYEAAYTEQDEALALIILDNNLQRWSLESKKILEKSPTNPDLLLDYKIKKAEMIDLEIPDTKYTMGVGTKKNNLRCGWSDTGIRVFNGFVKKVIDFRQTNDFVAAKKEAVRQMTPMFDSKKRKRKSASTENENSSSDDDCGVTENVWDELVQTNSFFQSV